MDYKIIYNGKEIVIDTYLDKYTVVLDDKEKTFDKVSDAINWIDAEEEREKARIKAKKPKIRVDALHNDYGEWSEVKVTSYAGQAGYGSKEKEYWTVTGKKRNKVDASRLYENSEANKLKIKDMEALKKERQRVFDSIKLADLSAFDESED